MPPSPLLLSFLIPPSSHFPSPLFLFSSPLPVQHPRPITPSLSPSRFFLTTPPSSSSTPPQSIHTPHNTHNPLPSSYFPLLLPFPFLFSFYSLFLLSFPFSTHFNCKLLSDSRKNFGELSTIFGDTKLKTVLHRYGNDGLFIQTNRS